MFHIKKQLWITNKDHIFKKSQKLEKSLNMNKEK